MYVFKVALDDITLYIIIMGAPFFMFYNPIVLKYVDNFNGAYFNTENFHHRRMQCFLNPIYPFSEKNLYF